MTKYVFQYPHAMTRVGEGEGERGLKGEEWKRRYIQRRKRKTRGNGRSEGK